MNPRELIVRRAAQELSDGEIVNLGFGMPTQTSNYLPKGINLTFHSENGALGFGAKPRASQAIADLTNAGSEPITMLPGASIFDLCTSFAMMRKGFIDTTILGALQADQEGNMSNWALKRNGYWWPGIGGAMDLGYGARKVVVCMMHTDKHGESKVKKRCTLPLTAKGNVKVIITDKAVFKVGTGHLILEEYAPGVELEWILANTEAEIVVSNDFHKMELDLTI